MENEGFGSPATAAKGTSTTQPERDLPTGDPNLFGGAADEEKKGIKDKVKGLLGRHGRKKDAQTPPGKVSKAKGKISHKAGHRKDGDAHGPAALLDRTSSSSSMSSSDEEDIGTVGFALDPTGPAVAGFNLGRRDYTSAPAGPGADFSKLSLKPDDHSPASDRHAKRAKEFAKWSNPMNPDSGVAHGEVHRPSQPTSNEDGRDDATFGGGDRSHPTEAGNYGGIDRSHPTEAGNYGGVGRSHPTEAGISNLNRRENDGGPYPGTDYSKQPATYDGEPYSNARPGATNGENRAVHGDYQEGPRDDNVNQGGFMSKIMDTIRGPEAEPAVSTTK